MDENSFRAALTRCGVEPVAARNAIVDQGYQNVVAFAELTDADINHLVKHLSRLPAPVTVPFSAIKKLKAMRTWTKWRQRRGLAIAHAEFDNDMLAWSLGRMEEESRIKALEAEAPAPPGPLTKLAKWPSWWETLDACASQVRGTMFLPLKYLCREHEVPTAEMLAATYDNTDDQLMALVRLQGDDFATDNHRLWDLLCPLLKDGPAWVWVKRFERTKNARGAIAALKLQAEGQAATQSRKAKAYQILRKATFTGRGKRFTFDDYVKLLQTGFNELAECEEEQSESRKLDVFMQTEPYSQWQNAAEGEHREVKRGIRRATQRGRSPKRLWDFCGKWVTAIRRKTAHDLPALDGMCAEERIHNRIIDMSAYAQFDWYEYVWYVSGNPNNRDVAGSRRQLGRWIGVAEDIGGPMTYFILPEVVAFR